MSLLQAPPSPLFVGGAYGDPGGADSVDAAGTAGVAGVAGAAGVAPESAALLDRICRCPSLPPLPRVVVDVLSDTSHAGRADANLQRLSALVGRDPALVSRILRVVNSSQFRLPNRVNSLSQALPVLGLRNLRVMITGASIFPAMKRCSASALDRLAWSRRSLYSAAAARMLAERLVEDDSAPCDDCFLSALLMDVGVLAMGEALGASYAGLLARAARHADLCSLERKELGLSHADVGAELARRWGLPEDLALPIQFHRDPAAAPAGRARRSAQVVRLAELCADVFVEQSPLWPISEACRLAAEDFGVAQAKMEQLLDDLAGEARKLGEAFEVHVDSSASFGRARQRVADEFLAGSAPDEAQSRPTGDRRRREFRSPRSGSITVIPCAAGAAIEGAAEAPAGSRPGIGRPFRAGFHNVSPSGIGLLCAEPMPPGSHFIVGLRRKGERVMVISYTVRHCQPAPDGDGFLVGAELTRAMREGDLNADSAGDSVLHRVARILLRLPPGGSPGSPAAGATSAT